ncbi:MAG: cytidine deaminase [Gemmatimonadota bacterium]
MVEREEAVALLEQARAARTNAYAPYSGFAVGAALLDEAGGVHTGANVENASYGLSTCAERSALAGAVGRGAREFRAIAVAGPEDGSPCPPCGSCRQILHEFGPEMTVVLEGGPGTPRLLALSDLLPEAFGPRSLGRGEARDGDGDGDG